MQLAFKTSMKLLAKANYLAARGVALRLFKIFLSKKKASFAHKNIRNILFIRIDRVGDMVLSTPAFEAIKTAFPQARLTVMASTVNAPVLKNNPHVDEVIVYDRFASIFGKIISLIGLRERRFDLAIDPYDDYELETAWMAWMSSATHRIGYACFGREVFLSEATLKTDRNKHFIDITLDLLKVIGVSYENKHPAIYLDEAEQSWAMQWMKEKGLYGKMIVAIHPGAYYETQRWPPEYFADLIPLIRKRTDAEVIVFGGPADAFVVEDILGRVDKPVCRFIEQDIRKFFAILSHCRLLVCNNSGPLHCAVALNVPSISFMGPTDKERWWPVGAMQQVLRRDDLPCISCNLGACKIKTHDCMRLIRPERLIEIILKKMC